MTFRADSPPTMQDIENDARSTNQYPDNSKKGPTTILEVMGPPPSKGNGKTQDHDGKAQAELSPLAGVECLKTVGEHEWLDPSNPPPPMPRLLTVKDARGKDACFLPLGRTAMLAAPGGTGKTQALMQLAVSVATGRSWLNTYDVAQSGRVLVIFGEEDQDEFHRRLTKCVEALELWGDADAMANLNRNLYPLPMYGKPVALLDEKGQETAFTQDLHRLLKANDWRLVILDPASRFMSTECETDNKAGTTWIECLERLTKVKGNPTVLFAHHTNKGALSGGETDQGAARGSSALTDGARWQANLEVVKIRVSDKPPVYKVQPNRCTLRVVKSNYGPRTDALELGRDPEHGGFLHCVDKDTLETERAAGDKDNKKLKASEDKRTKLLNEAKRQLEKFEDDNAQVSIDEKKRNSVDRERATLERRVRDAERDLDKVRALLPDDAEEDKKKPTEPKQDGNAKAVKSNGRAANSSNDDLENRL